MAQPTKKSPKRSNTKIIPPKNKNTENLSKDEVRYLNKKRVKRKRRLKKLLCGFLFAGVVFAGFILLALTVIFKIENIQIKGAKLYEDKVVIEKSGIALGDGLFISNEEKVSEILSENLPYIKNVKLERKIPDTLIIEVFPTRECAAFKNKNGYILVDSSGKVLDTKADMLRDNVAVVKGEKTVNAQLGQKIELSDEDLTDDFLTVLKGIDDSEMTDITAISIDKKGNFSLTYQGRIKIRLGSTDNLLVVLDRAKAAIDKENEINPYSEGTLNLEVEPYAYFHSGDEEKVTIAAGYVTDKYNNLVTDKYGELVTVSESNQQYTE